MLRKSSRARKKSRRPGHGELKTIAEIARALGETDRTIRNWQYKGIVPWIKLGHKTIRFRLDDVLAALQKRRVK
jgi:predicted site-specific integrase-resolvase